MSIHHHGFCIQNKNTATFRSQDPLLRLPVVEADNDGHLFVNIGEIFRCDLSHVTNTVAIHSPQTVGLLVSTTLVFEIVMMVEQKKIEL